LTADWKTGRPYRPNVGICLINNDGLVWLGKCESSGPEIVTPGREWQMPQGLWEETGVRSASVLSVTEEWWAYDFPDHYHTMDRFDENCHKLSPFRGQKQKWVAFRFTGSDAEIDISAAHTQEPQEFLSWRWMKVDDATSQCVTFKVAQYQRVLR